ncbi:MAG: cupin domain-containing protein [Vicinamibacterales bacterium]|nr:cupin domain-containing protein [Vicinamibacterales bacterium]
MIQVGFETTDPFTQTRSVIIKGATETGGRGWVIEVHCPDGAPPVVLEHVHLTWSETFEILQGTAAYTLGGEQHALKAGETVLMPPGVSHIHPWNTGAGVMVYRQTTDFGEATPGAVQDVLGAFATINGLAREGRIGKKGLPKNPLQFAATLRTLTKYGGFDAAVPIPIQRVLSATLGRVAEAVGYRGVYERYLQPPPGSG